MTHFLVAGDHFVAVLFLPPVCPPVWIFSQFSSDLPLLRSWRFLCCNMDWGEHCDYGLALTPGFFNLLFCSALRSLQRRKPIPCFVLSCCSSSKITFWLTYFLKICLSCDAVVEIPLDPYTKVLLGIHTTLRSLLYRIQRHLHPSFVTILPFKPI